MAPAERPTCVVCGAPAVVAQNGRGRACADPHHRREARRRYLAEYAKAHSQPAPRPTLTCVVCGDTYQHLTPGPASGACDRPECRETWRRAYQGLFHRERWRTDPAYREAAIAWQREHDSAEH